MKEITWLGSWSFPGSSKIEIFLAAFGGKLSRENWAPPQRGWPPEMWEVTVLV